MVSSCAQCSTQQARSQEPKFKLQTSKRPANSGVGAAGRGARSVSRGGGADARACTGSRPRPRLGPLRPVPRPVRPAKRRPGAEIWRRPRGVPAGRPCQGSSREDATVLEPRGAPAVITRHLERKGEAGGDRSPGGGVALDGSGEKRPALLDSERCGRRREGFGKPVVISRSAS